MSSPPWAVSCTKAKTSRCNKVAAGKSGGNASGQRMANKRSKLQLLFDLAQRTFAEPGQPAPAQIDVLKLALSSVPLAELGIEHSEECACAEESCPGRQPPADPRCSIEESSCPSSPSGPRQPITYLHIHEDNNLSLGIFCLPANAQIPLHNHPGMTVLSRVLFGKMHVKSYDWVDRQSEGRPQREATRVLNRVYSAADEPAVLFPSSGGNIHQFTAVTDCAVLDLLGPPYSTDDGRDCLYYKELPASSNCVLDRNVVVLAEQEPPTDFVIDSGVYKGRPVRQRPYMLRSTQQCMAAGLDPAVSRMDTQLTIDSANEAHGSGPASAGSQDSSSSTSAVLADGVGSEGCGSVLSPPMRELQLGVKGTTSPGAVGAAFTGLGKGKHRLESKKSGRRRSRS